MIGALFACAESIGPSHDLSALCLIQSFRGLGRLSSSVVTEEMLQFEVPQCGARGDQRSLRISGLRSRRTKVGEGA